MPSAPSPSHHHEFIGAKSLPFQVRGGKHGISQRRVLEVLRAHRIKLENMGRVGSSGEDTGWYQMIPETW